MVSPIFDFSSVAASDHIYLRFWTWMYGLRTGTLTVELGTTASVDGYVFDFVEQAWACSTQTLLMCCAHTTVRGPRPWR